MMIGSIGLGILVYVLAPGIAFYFFGKRDVMTSFLFALAILGIGLILGLTVGQGVLGLLLMAGVYYYLLVMSKKFKAKRPWLLIGTIFLIQILVGALIVANIIGQIGVGVVEGLA